MLTRESLYGSSFNSDVMVTRERVDESWQVRVCTRVFSTLMSWSNENKSCMRVDKREFVPMRVLSTQMSWSNENKSFMIVDESRQVGVCIRVLNSHYVLVK